MVRTGHSHRKKANDWTEVPSSSLLNTPILRVTELKQLIPAHSRMYFRLAITIVETMVMVFKKR
jgi:hypothetical protein